MSFSPFARVVLHNSADLHGNPRPAWLRDHPILPEQRRRPRAAAPQTSLVPQEQPPQFEPVRFVTPPRHRKWPNSRLIINTPIPRAGTLADPAVCARFAVTDSPIPLALPTRGPSTNIVSLAPPEITTVSDPNSVAVNGRKTRKRRAQDTEIELVAAVNGIQDTTAPIIIIREGETVPNQELGQQANITYRMLGFLPGAGSLTRMISSIYTAVTGLGDRIVYPRSYRIAEFRSYLSDRQLVNKRIKVSDDQGDAVHENAASTSEGGVVRWVDRDSLTALIDEYKLFVRAVSKVWDCFCQGGRQQANKELEPLRIYLADNKADLAMLDNGQGHDLCELFSLQFKRAFECLDHVYEIGVVVKVRDNNETVPPVLDYKLSPSAIENMVSIKNFLSAPGLPVICHSILQKYGEHDTKLSQAFVDRMILDLEAIIRNIPAPSYVLSQEYHDKLQATFPPPARTDLDTHFLLPGSFPEVDEPKEPVKAPTKELVQVLPREVDMVEPSVPVSRRPVISRPNFTKADFLHVNITQKNIDRITPEDYRATFYDKSQEHRVIKETHVTEFAPQVPLNSTEAGSIRSILRNRRKHPSKVTPKRLGVRRLPKAVRFTESTLSPKQRTHLGLDVPKQINYDDETGEPVLPSEDFRERPAWARSWVNRPAAPREERVQLHDRTLPPRPTFQHLEQKDGLDPTSRIDELFALPSVKLLEISADSRAGIQFQKERAARKAAEEARQAAEAARREAEEKARKELEERLARSGGLRMPSQVFVGPLSAEWRAKAQETLRAASTTTLAKTLEGVDLRRHDFAKVVPSTEWLNDEIVNGSLAWLDQAINSAAGIKDVKKNTRKCLAMSSFFFKRLQDQGVARTQRTLRRYGVEKRNFLDVDTILLPICEHSHWTLLIIRPSKRTVAHMDSLNARGNSVYTSLGVAWLKDVLEEKFIKDEWKVILHEAPRQTNGHDCGVHVITNAMCVSLGLSPIDSYAAQDMPAQRIRIACMLLNGGFKGEFDLRVY
ncbi:hypothetical protein FZEAL_1849 [Fusarium zealandicum]|uniref:Ubiquitin-like protease family profile domain-containing protein n=1 Tax=Fusarium zealandicum TaxID=1053134 RepID=A0A8H4USP1_9HYPO|nr:hypothetical protein FZEAL_1849 [Fusarium zealandicum]